MRKKKDKLFRSKNAKANEGEIDRDKQSENGRTEQTEEPDTDARGQAVVFDDGEDVAVGRFDSTIGADAGRNKSQRNKLFEAFRYSYNFFSEGIKEWLRKLNLNENTVGTEACLDVLRANKEVVKKQIDLLSKIFKDIYSIKFHAKLPNVKTKKIGGITVFDEDGISGAESGGIGRGIIEILKNANELDCKTVLFLKGPTGSYKNRLLQLVYLYTIASKAEEERGYAHQIFYVDFKDYEAKRRNLDEDIAWFNSHFVACPLIFLDNVREFKCGMQDKYVAFKERVLGRECKIVLSVDALYTKNSCRLASFCRDFDPETSSNGFKAGNKINITSLNLNREAASKEFLKNCLNYFSDDQDSSTPEEIDRAYKFLTGQHIFTIDAYQLKSIMDQTSGRFTDEKIIDIYSSYSSDLDAPKAINQAAFEYDYTQNACNWEYSGWNILRRHKSILDFFSAQYYSDRIIEFLDTNDLDKVPALITPKSLTRFINPDIFDKYETRLIKSIKNVFHIEDDNPINWDYYINLSQLIFLLGKTAKARDNSAESNDEDGVSEMLRKIKNKILDDKSAVEDYKKLLVLRSVYMSLIRREVWEALNEYCLRLIKETDGGAVGTWNGLNNGIHLDYYGDNTNNHYLVNHDVKFQDDAAGDKTGRQKKIGIITFRKLSIDLRRYFDSPEQNSPLTCVFQLLTYCKLMEARQFEYLISSEEENFIANLCIFIKKFMLIYEKDGEGVFKKLDQGIVTYFREVADQLKKKLQKLNEKNNSYFIYSKLPLQKRAGWCKREIFGGNSFVERSESVAEHIYNCMLLAFMYLPSFMENEPRYNKNMIINLLLIHDIGEAVLGDIPSYQKDKEEKSEEIKEIINFLDTLDLSKETKDRLLNMVTNMESGESRPAPSELRNIKGRNLRGINVQIAKEIDYLQGAIQYFIYFMDRDRNKLRFLSEFKEGEDRTVIPEEAVDEQVIVKNIDEWLLGVDNTVITTEIGRSIRDRLILNNLWFRSDVFLFERFDAFKNNGFRISG